MVESNGVYKKQDIWVLDTIGTNLLDVLGLDFIDNKRTLSNDIVEIYNILGIEAARQTIYNELVDVVEFDGTYINFHNYSVLVDRMTATEKLISIFRHGINNDNIGPIAKASFEETPGMFFKAARHGELDDLKGISANIMCGQEGLYGTNCFQLLLDVNEISKLEDIIVEEEPTNEEVIEKAFSIKLNDEDKTCSLENLTINTNLSNIKKVELGKMNSYMPNGF
jgi:DNA-directed RNA polymerase II subunit RPB1